jgi:hypothetical protein
MKKNTLGIVLAIGFFSLLSVLSIIALNADTAQAKDDPTKDEKKPACGGAQKPYYANDNGYSGEFCSPGKSNPFQPPFPARGGSAEWKCTNNNGDAFCSASRSKGISDDLKKTIGSNRNGTKPGEIHIEHMGLDFNNDNMNAGVSLRGTW